MDSFFNECIKKLQTAGIAMPRLETRMLWADILKCAPAEVYENTPLTEEQKSQVSAMLQRRLLHEPMDKILGHREFYKSDFKVNADVLSPRPDTETLVESALNLLPENTQAKILDLGTGSGCIIISLLAERLKTSGVAIDISPTALAVAKENAERLNMCSRLKFICADWFQADFTTYLTDKFDVIVSNPPYIPSIDIAKLDDEVKKYDPRIALDGGADGYNSYRRIAELAPDILKDEGFLILEAGYNQAEDIRRICEKNNMTHFKTVKDLAGINRCVIMKKAVAETKKI
ncbi:MAG: peptide chain release factor N(5)-glutamine methyltransferase [Alphaproteobacteria bacterium]|nr:peptide chain release factor N(5)-glutamine methyltransferase [Alphaproteobacteria bacterium]